MTGDSPRIWHVVGARPNFPKMGPVWRALSERRVPQRIVHTGQHYDDDMSAAFFRDLSLPHPDINLEIGSGTQAGQTAAIMIALEELFAVERPELVVVYGDVNSTLAAALVCAKSGLRLAHVEAGLRSFDNAMPEEINRRITDILADLLLVTSPDAITNLEAEGVGRDRIVLVGNPMIDSLLMGLQGGGATEPSDHVKPWGSRYALATLHRPSNVDTAEAAHRAVAMLREVTRILPVVLPLHPRGRERLREAGLDGVPNLHTLGPQPYLEFVHLVAGSQLVITDSGGIQEESTILGVPCLTVRTTTERPITITHGTNQLVSMEDAPRAAADILAGVWVPPEKRPPLWDGHAGERIADALVDLLQSI